MKQPQPKVDLDATSVHLRKVAMDHAAERLGEFTADAVKAEISPHAFLDKVLDAELAFREERRRRHFQRVTGALRTISELARRRSRNLRVKRPTLATRGE